MAQIDTGIYAALLRPPKSVAELDAEARLARAQELDIGDRMDRRAASARQMQRQSQLETLMRGLPAGASDEQRLQALRGGAYFAEADALESGMLKRNESRANVRKTTADTNTKEFELGQKQWQENVQAITSFRSAEDARQYLATLVSKAPPEQQPERLERARSMLSTIPTDPAEFEGWKNQTRMSLLDAGQQLKFVMPDANAKLSAETTRRGQDVSAATARAGQAVTMRGQDLTDRRAAEANQIGAKAVDLQLKTDKLNNEREDRARGRESAVAQFDTSMDTLKRLRDHPGLRWSVGLPSAIPNLPGSDASDFAAELEAFKAQVFPAMIANAKASGLTGALSDAEGKKLTAAVGALDPSMSQKRFKESIDRIMADLGAARRRAGRMDPVASGGGGASPLRTVPTAGNGWSITRED